jgi:endopolyphosphatase
MQVWLTGHVPPHSGNYYDTCCKLRMPACRRQIIAYGIGLRYGDLSLRYQDTIVGHLYGHM